MKTRAWTCLWWVFGGCASCEWQTLDAITPVAPQQTDDGGQDASFDGSAPLPDTSAVSPPDSAREAETVRPLDSGAETSAPSCNSKTPPLRAWTFESDGEQWALIKDSDADASLTWTGVVGHPTLGAIALSVPVVSNAMWARRSHDFGDLRNRTLSAWVWLESGANPHLKVFAQSGSEYTWADAGTISLTPRTWTCVALNFSAPAYHDPGYDPRQIVVVGIEVKPESPAVLYLDSVRVD